MTLTTTPTIEGRSFKEYKHSMLMVATSGTAVVVE